MGLLITLVLWYFVTGMLREWWHVAVAAAAVALFWASVKYPDIVEMSHVLDIPTRSFGEVLVGAFASHAMFAYLMYGMRKLVAMWRGRG